MELEGLLQEDSVLPGFFNAYLAMEVFPVNLQYDPRMGHFTEVGGASLPCQWDPGVRCRLLGWAEDHRWQYFIRSAAYTEYRLCKLLTDERPTSPLDRYPPQATPTDTPLPPVVDRPLVRSGTPGPGRHDTISEHVHVLTCEDPALLLSSNRRASKTEAGETRPLSLSSSAPSRERKFAQHSVSAHMLSRHPRVALGSIGEQLPEETSRHPRVALGSIGEQLPEETLDCESVMSSCLPEELWGEAEEITDVCEEITEECAVDEGECCGLGLQYPEFVSFKESLQGTQGLKLMEVWVELELWQLMGFRQKGEEIRDVREKCRTIQELCQLPTHQTSKADLVSVCQTATLKRLQFYWLPRFQIQRRESPRRGQRSVPSLVGRSTSPDWSCDSSEPFVRGLKHDRLAGRPFQHYLQKHRGPASLSLLLFWEATDQFLHLSSGEASQLQLCRAAWRVWTEFLSEGAPHAPSPPPEDSLQLWTSLQLGDFEAARTTITKLQCDALSQLKRLWTQYLRHDHQLYTGCCDPHRRKSPPHEPSATPPVRPSTSKCSRRRKNKPPVDTLEPSDLEEGPLGLLGDMDTLLSFEHFLYTKMGPLSNANLCYQLWRSVAGYRRLPTSRKPLKDRAAIKIYRVFLFEDSRRRVRLPERAMRGIDLAKQICRLTTPTLLALQEASAEVFEPVIRMFLGNGEWEHQVVAPLPPFERGMSKKLSRSISSSGQITEDALFLTSDLSTCEGPASQKLISFSCFLQSHAPLGGQDVLVNGVQFWLEVKKFKAMFENHTSICVLYHKAEALVDRYLDTTTPPWIKVSISPELASSIVKRVGELFRLKLWSHVAALCGLLSQAQDTVFSEMLPFWRPFCLEYRDPTGPQGAMAAPSTRSTSARSHDPPSLPSLEHGNRTTLLSYSKLKGLQWKSPINL